MSAATLSIQEVNGFPVLVCQSEKRREVYEVQSPSMPAPEPEEPTFSSSLKEMLGFWRSLGGDA